MRALSLLACLSGMLACYQPEASIQHVEEPEIDAGEATPDAAPEADAAQDAAGAQPTLHFHVLTLSQRGRYSPRNIGAIWIEDATGKFVKTLEVWAAIRARYLRRFNTASAGDTTDAITSATLLLHEPHTPSWDFRDRAGALVPDGDYVLLIEVTDRDASGDSLAIPFKKGVSEPLPPLLDAEHFRELQLWLE